MSSAQDRTTLGILLMIGFAVSGPLIDTFGKLAAPHMSVGQLAAARFTVQALLLLPLAGALRALHWPEVREVGLHVARAAMILVATACFFAALREMPIADAMAIFFVEPFILTLLGGLVLGEAVGWRRVLACVIGFGGALLVIQPRFAELGGVAMLPLGTAGCFAVYMLLTRAMATRIHPVTMQAYTALAAMMLIWPALALGGFLGVAELTPSLPEALHFLWLICIGIAAAVAHLFLSYALRFASAATIAPLQYLEIVSATIIGYLVFADVPDVMMLAGVAVIVGSGLYVFAREARAGRVKRPPPAP
jgi:drug/metabolite transporter (DMT)-like permease